MRGLMGVVAAVLVACGCLGEPLKGGMPLCPESPSAVGWCHKSEAGVECADECVPSCMSSCPDCDDCQICAFCR
jgi:hypothetical protein